MSDLSSALEKAHILSLTPGEGGEFAQRIISAIETVEGVSEAYPTLTPANVKSKFLISVEHALDHITKTQILYKKSEKAEYGNNFKQLVNGIEVMSTKMLNEAKDQMNITASVQAERLSAYADEQPQEVRLDERPKRPLTGVLVNTVRRAIEKGQKENLPSIRSKGKFLFWQKDKQKEEEAQPEKKMTVVDDEVSKNFLLEILRRKGKNGKADIGFVQNFGLDVSELDFSLRAGTAGISSEYLKERGLITFLAKDDKQRHHPVCLCLNIGSAPAIENVLWEQIAICYCTSPDHLNAAFKLKESDYSGFKNRVQDTFLSIIAECERHVSLDFPVVHFTPPSTPELAALEYANVRIKDDFGVKDIIRSVESEHPGIMFGFNSGGVILRPQLSIDKPGPLEERVKKNFEMSLHDMKRAYSALKEVSDKEAYLNSAVSCLILRGEHPKINKEKLLKEIGEFFEPDNDMNLSP